MGRGKGKGKIRKGQRFGRLTATGLSEIPMNTGVPTSLVVCDCGERLWRRDKALHFGNANVCGPFCPVALREKIDAVPIEDRLTLEQHTSLFGTCHQFVPNAEAEPTEHPPGTQEKIELMRERLENGQPLFVDGDRQDFEGEAPGRVEPRISPEHIFSGKTDY